MHALFHQSSWVENSWSSEVGGPGNFGMPSSAKILGRSADVICVANVQLIGVAGFYHIDISTNHALYASYPRTSYGRKPISKPLSAWAGRLYFHHLLASKQPASPSDKPSAITPCLPRSSSSNSSSRFFNIPASNSAAGIGLWEMTYRVS